MIPDTGAAIVAATVCMLAATVCMLLLSVLVVLVLFCLWSYESKAQQRRFLLALEVVLEGSEKMADHWNAPRLTQELLPLAPAHVGHVRVMFWEPKHPVGHTAELMNQSL